LTARHSLWQPSAALLTASLTKLATLFLALVFRREFLDSSSDLRPLHQFLSRHLLSALSPLPATWQIERRWMLGPDDLKDVLVRGGLGGTSAVVAFSGALSVSVLLPRLDRKQRSSTSRR
jgi:hypothetical protein